MKATNWEFTNRALVFGMILGFSGILVLGIRGGAGCLCHNLKLKPFFAILGASLVWFWASSAVLQKKRNSKA